MQIQKIGNYYDLDTDGYIINPAAQEKIQEEWRPVVEAIQEAYISAFKDSVLSVYVRGSVAKGKAIQHISDVDTFCILNLKENEINWELEKVISEQIEERFPFIQKAEIACIPVEEALESKADRIMIKTQSICLYGKDFSEHIKPMKPGEDIIQHLPGIENEIHRTLIWLDERHESEKIRSKCSWIMKRILRAGLELVSERTNKYTRDLYPCLEAFTMVYPDKENEMEVVLDLAINPSDDSLKIKNILETTGKWLITQLPK